MIVPIIIMGASLVLPHREGRPHTGEDVLGGLAGSETEPTLLVLLVLGGDRNGEGWVLLSKPS